MLILTLQPSYDPISLPPRTTYQDWIPNNNRDMPLLSVFMFNFPKHVTFKLQS